MKISKLIKIIKEEVNKLVPRIKICKGNFRCGNNDLNSLEGAPKYVGGIFSCRDNKKKFTKEEVMAVCEVKGDIYV